MPSIAIERDGLCLTVEISGACARDERTRSRYVDYVEEEASVVLIEPDESDDVSAWRVGTTVQLTPAEIELAGDALLREARTNGGKT